MPAGGQGARRGGAAATNVIDSVTSSNTNVSSRSSGGQKSQVKVWAGLCSLHRLQGRVVLPPPAPGGLVCTDSWPHPTGLCLRFPTPSPLCPLLFSEGPVIAFRAHSSFRVLASLDPECNHICKDVFPPRPQCAAPRWGVFGEPPFTTTATDFQLRMSPARHLLSLPVAPVQTSPSPVRAPRARPLALLPLVSFLPDRLPNQNPFPMWWPRAPGATEPCNVSRWNRDAVRVEDPGSRIFLLIVCGSHLSLSPFVKVTAGKFRITAVARWHFCWTGPVWSVSDWLWVGVGSVAV